MKQKIQQIKPKEKDETSNKKIDNAKKGILFVFSVCISSLFLFFALAEEAPPSVENSSEVLGVFKQTYLYDFLDLEKCENEQNIEGSV